jgi:hypothetical protein
VNRKRRRTRQALGAGLDQKVEIVAELAEITNSRVWRLDVISHMALDRLVKDDFVLASPFGPLFGTPAANQLYISVDREQL